MPTGFVSLVGAGPGDPELLTLKALRRLQEADVVVYDYLVNPDLLGHCRDDAQLVYVGKRTGRHSCAQAAINALLIAHARSGQRVVRLKGGDPFIFGRGGEEAEALVEAGLPWEVVPGISSAVAAPAYAGIPLTHRSLASSCAILTGHEALGAARGFDGRAALAADTLVILMGIERLSLIADRLLAHGRPPTTPAAVIRWGTTPQQETLLGTLGTIAGLVEAQGIKPPAVIVVGEVVRCAQRLAWFAPPASMPAAATLELRQPALV